MEDKVWEVAIVGAGLAGLSAAIYLGRARRSTLVIDSGKSMAVWEPRVENYLGFPEGISGEDILERGRRQIEKYSIKRVEDVIQNASGVRGGFLLEGNSGTYKASRVLLATGIYHVPPDIPGIKECLGQSMFFCKDCDGYRVQNKTVAIAGKTNEAVEYALGMLAYTPDVFVLTNGESPTWGEIHGGWLKQYAIPVFHEKITGVEHCDGIISSLVLEGGQKLLLEIIFTVRGDLVRNSLAKQLGAQLDESDQIIVDCDSRTSVPGLYAAGCVTPANCQMIISAGQGATSAQAINHDLFEESLRNGTLRHLRHEQIQTEVSQPEIVVQG